MTLPDSCALCEPYGGTWAETPTGLKRCDCARGRAIAAMATAKPREPVMSTEAATVFARMLTVIPYFPAGESVLSTVADEIASLCEGVEQAKWLVRRMRRLYQRWPGLPEMRLVYVSKFQPLDGIQPVCASEFYPEGIPGEAESQAPQIAAAPMKALPAGEPVTAALSIAATVADLCELKDLNRMGPAPRVREIPVLRDEQRVTPEMIAEAVRKNREAQGRAELGL